MLALMLILYTRYMGRQTKNILPQSTLITLCSSDAAFRTKNNIVMSTSRGRYSGVLQQFVRPSCDWIQVLKALIFSCPSWSLLSEAITSVDWCFNQWTPPHGFSHGSWASILCTCQMLKLHGHLCKVQASLLSLRQLDQFRFFQLAISWSRITIGHLF